MYAAISRRLRAWPLRIGGPITRRSLLFGSGFFLIVLTMPSGAHGEMKFAKPLKVRPVPQSAWKKSATRQLAVTVQVIPAADRPKTLALHQNWPNPCHYGATIRYELPEASFVSLRIFNISGQQIASLVSGVMPLGVHDAAWDGKNTEGTRVASGIYLYQLIASGKTITRRLCFIR